MDSANGDSLAACLSQWVRSFEGVAAGDGLSELADGLALWHILQTIDADYFSGSLPEPAVGGARDWTRKWQNLKYVEKQVSTYYRDVCNEQDQINAESMPDVKAIAAEGSTADMEKLIMAIIRAAMASPESNQKMAQRLMSLGRENAVLIANELRSMEETGNSEGEAGSRDESEEEEGEEPPVRPDTNGAKVATAVAYKDPLLEREEELLQAQATIDKLEASHGRAERQMKELRQEKERLQEAFDAYRSDIESKGRHTGGEDAFKKLQRQTDNDRAYIDDLENQLTSSKSTMDNYERQIQRYKDDGEYTQKLRDELQLLKADNADLSQKIKANENLKKKIQTLQEQEKLNAALRDEMKQANERLEGLDRLKQVQAGLEKEIIEKQGLIRNQEYQITELSTTRKHAEYDARLLAQKLQEAKERHDRDHETIQELRGRFQDSTLEESNSDQNAADTEEAPSTSNNRHKSSSGPTDSETKHLNDKIALLLQQLETADQRLKQATDRNATLEDQQRTLPTIDPEAQKLAEKQIHEHEITITSLRRELESAQQKQKQAEAATAATPVVPQDLAQLQRENRLMATAFFDLSARVQSNSVSLARRRQDPKSWIARQRLLVGPSSVPPR